VLVGYSRRLNCFRIGRSRSISLAINSLLKGIAINASFLSISNVRFEMIDLYQSSFYYTSSLPSLFHIRYLICDLIAITSDRVLI